MLLFLKEKKKKRERVLNNIRNNLTIYFCYVTHSHTQNSFKNLAAQGVFIVSKGAKIVTIVKKHLLTHFKTYRQTDNSSTSGTKNLKPQDFCVKILENYQ